MFKRFKTQAEKDALKFGIVIGKNSAKQSKVDKPRSVRYFDGNLNRMVTYTPAEIQEMHKEYDFGKKRSDLEVIDAYTDHMRYNYGHFDDNGKFKGMISKRSNKK